MLPIQQLTVAHVILIGNKGDMHGSLKYCNFKTSKHPWKIWKCKISILNVLKERPTAYGTTFNELAIRNTLFIK